MHHNSFAPSLKFLLISIVLAILILIVKLVLARSGGAKFNLKTPLLSAAEQELYRRLVAALPEHVILAQVAFSQMITVAGGDSNENFRKRLTARQKVADFVVCDKSFKVIAVVELDDSTHSAARDEKRDKITIEAGSKTIRWRATKQPGPEEIRRSVLS